MLQQFLRLPCVRVDLVSTRRGQSALLKSASSLFSRVYFYVHFARVMPQRMGLGTANPGSPDQRLVELQQVGALDGIRLMMDAGAVELMFVIGGVEDVALDQKMLERSRRGRRHDP